MRSLLILWLLTATTLSPALAHEPHVTVPDGLEVIPFPGHSVRVLSGPGDTPAQTAVLELEMPPKTFGAPPHVHQNEDEHFYVLEGAVDFLDRGEVHRAHAGATVVLPRGHLHGFWNDTNETARLLLIISPGQFTGFFGDVVSAIRKENAADPATVGRLIAETAAAHDVTIHMDQVPESALHLLPK